MSIPPESFLKIRHPESILDAYGRDILIHNRIPFLLQGSQLFSRLKPQEQHRLPSITELRNRIDQMKKNRAKQCLRLQFLTASRTGEIAGPHGIKAGDLQQTTYENHPVALFTVKCEKVKERAKIIALPLQESYEPWTQSILEYFKRKQPDELAFDVSTRQMEIDAAEAFKELWYWISDYGDVPGHWKKFSTHALRYMRTDQLIAYYGFDGLDLAIFCGWSLRTEQSMPAMGARYASLIYRQWSRYFPKLLKPLSVT